MTFSFKPSLAPQVESRRKITTIRDCSRRMPREGMAFTAVTGARFAPRVIRRATILEVLPIKIDLRTPLEIKVEIDGYRLTEAQMPSLVRMEGFDNETAMRRFFLAAHGPVLLPSDTWRIIHWGEADLKDIGLPLVSFLKSIPE